MANAVRGDYVAEDLVVAHRFTVGDRDHHAWRGSVEAMGHRLGIDLDGVVTDFTGGWIALYNSEFGANVEVKSAVTWGAPVELTHFKSMSKFWKWARTCGDGRSLFRVLDPYPGALEGLDALVNAGHDIVIITTKPNFAVRDTHEWLVEHEVPATEVHIVDNKAAIECDMYLDDAQHNLTSYVNARQSATVVRWVQPWNSPMPGVVDASTWCQVGAIASSVERS